MSVRQFAFGLQLRHATNRHCEAVMLPIIRRGVLHHLEYAIASELQRSWQYLSAFSYAPMAHPVAPTQP